MPTIAQARQSFTDLLGRAHYGGERTKVTRRDTPYGGIVSSEDVDTLEDVDRLLEEEQCASLDELRARLREMKAAEKM